jgi:hypothetical protein
MIALLLLGLTIGLALGMLTRFGVDSAWTKARQIRHERKLSKKEVLTLFAVAIVGFTGWLYLTTFAGIMYSACRSGEIIIRADSLLHAESILLICVSNGLAFMTTHIFVTHLRKPPE